MPSLATFDIGFRTLVATLEATLKMAGSQLNGITRKKLNLNL